MYSCVSMYKNGASNWYLLCLYCRWRNKYFDFDLIWFWSPHTGPWGLVSFGTTIRNWQIFQRKKNFFKWFTKHWGMYCFWKICKFFPSSLGRFVVRTFYIQDLFVVQMVWGSGHFEAWEVLYLGCFCSWDICCWDVLRLRSFWIWDIL